LLSQTNAVQSSSTHR